MRVSDRSRGAIEKNTISSYAVNSIDNCAELAPKVAALAVVPMALHVVCSRHFTAKYFERQFKLARENNSLRGK